MKPVSLQVLFENNKQSFKDALSGLTIPSDVQKIQDVISEHLSNLLLEEGDFRQNLTVSEDYILQAVLKILNAYQARFTCLPNAMIKHTESFENVSVEEQEQQPTDKKLLSDVALNNISTPSIAAGVGALAGGALLGTWGAVCGAIACTAISAYMIEQHSDNKPSKNTIKKQITATPIVEQSLDIDAIVNVIDNLCHSVDDIITTFRAQLNKVIHKYESQEKPTIEREYSTLLENIQSLVGYKRAHCNDEKFSKKIQERIEDLAESLENYNLSLVDYDGNNISMFDLIPSANTTEKKQVYPAITKADVIVKKGKIFIPEN